MGWILIGYISLLVAIGYKKGNPFGYAFKAMVYTGAALFIGFVVFVAATIAFGD